MDCSEWTDFVVYQYKFLEVGELGKEANADVANAAMYAQPQDRQISQFTVFPAVLITNCYCFIDFTKIQVKLGKITQPRKRICVFLIDIEFYFID